MVSKAMSIYRASVARSILEDAGMNGLLGKFVTGLLVGLSLGSCAKQSDTPLGFDTQTPGSSGASDDGSNTLGSSEAGIVTIPTPVIDDASLVTITSLSTDGGGTVHAGAPLQLVFVPASATITVDGTGPQTQSFSLQADFGGGLMPVTAQSVEFDRPDLATVTDTEPVVATAPATASATPYGGTGFVHAI